MVEPLKKDNITNTFEIWKDLQKQWKEHCGIGDTKYYIEVSRIKELLKDVLNFAVVTNDKIELQCKIINTFSILFDNGNDGDRLASWCKAENKPSVVAPRTSDSAGEEPAVPTQSPLHECLLCVKDKPSQEQLGDVTTQPVGVSYSTPKEIILMGEKFIECSECGHNIIRKRTTKFCGGCGRKIKWVEK